MLTKIWQHAQVEQIVTFIKFSECSLLPFPPAKLKTLRAVMLGSTPERQASLNSCPH